MAAERSEAEKAELKMLKDKIDKLEKNQNDMQKASYEMEELHRKKAKHE